MRRRSPVIFVTVLALLTSAAPPPPQQRSHATTEKPRWPARCRAEEPIAYPRCVPYAPAFGQRLRGDTYLGSYGFADIRALAGDPRRPWREQFIALTRLAERGSGGGAGGGGR
ncbi:hypothetical protein [Sphingomonas sp.]|uniref:hypothetical protein n=1 Tax=Sphingomonas sp. TaxID=28214 RepID=UPI003CC5B78A